MVIEDINCGQSRDRWMFEAVAVAVMLLSLLWLISSNSVPSLPRDFFFFSKAVGV